MCHGQVGGHTDSLVSMSMSGRRKGAVVPTSYLWALFVCLKIGGEAGILRLKIQETKEKTESREAGGAESRAQVKGTAGRGESTETGVNAPQGG